MTTIRHTADGFRPALGWARRGAGWLALLAGTLAAALAWLVAMLRPSVGDTETMALALALSGGGSLLAGAALLRLIDATHVLGVRVKLAVPAILAALVVALNTVIAAQLMFIAGADVIMLLGFLGFGLVLALALSSSAAQSLAAALRQVEHGARRVAEGDYGFRLPARRMGDVAELQRLAGWFNHMAASVQDAFARRDAAEAQRRQMFAALSHDMRTPLAATRAMIESIDDGVVGDPAEVARYHRAIRGELRRLSGLIDDLFLLARIENGTLALDYARIDLGDLISDLLEATRGQAEQRGIRLSGTATDLPLVRADARQITRALGNVVQNALRHTPAGGAIAIVARADGEQVVIEIADTGEGIAPADLPHVFEPAYRGEASRARRPADDDEAEGGGFGLTIARGILHAHGGTILALSPAILALNGQPPILALKGQQPILALKGQPPILALKGQGTTNGQGTAEAGGGTVIRCTLPRNWP